jgi:hypothetical protein
MSQPLPEHDEAFALIIDTSSSAAPYLDEARHMAQLIYDLTGVTDEEQIRLFMLGNTAPISLAALKQTSPPGVVRQSQPCSLIAPIMEALAQEGKRRHVIIVGSGEIFDLEDWAGDPEVDGWLLVRVGERPLQGADGRLSEITPDQINGDMDTILSYFTRPVPGAAETPRYTWDPDAFKWAVDASGYPLVFVEPLGAYVQLFPVAKPQFERFLASGKHPEFGDDWYEEILTMNPRASCRSQDVTARERLFITGVTHDEALAFGRWMGRDYSLLTAQEWATCYEWFATRPAPVMPRDLSSRLSWDALAVWGVVEGQWLEGRWQTSLRDLSLMTQGILEWVVERPGRYCGLGEPAATKLQRKADDPVRPVGQRRLRNLGFRLRMR